MALTVPFETMMAVFGVGTSVVAILTWLVEEGHAAAPGRLPAAPRRLWQCHICAAFYSRDREEQLTIWPQCGSYNSGEGVHTP